MSSTHAKSAVRVGGRPGSTVRRSSSRRGAARSRGPGPLAIGGIVLLAAWAAAATWFAVSGRSAVARLTEEQGELRLAYDDKIRALTRRLVGVASHQVLEQDGLSGRLADIISRQVQLENRQSALTLMADRLSASVPQAAGTAGGAPTPAQPQTSPRNPAPSEPPTLKLGGSGGPAASGAPAAGGSAGAADPLPRPRSSLDDDLVPKTASGRALQTAAALPLREQFSALETWMGRLEGTQIRLLDSLSAGVQSAVGTIRSVIASLGLEARPDGPADDRRTQPLRLSGRRQVDPFEGRVASLEQDFGQLQRWKTVVDAVPLRRPVEGGNNLTSNFGTRKDPFTGAGAMHAGMDFRGPVGTPIRASAAGRVITADVTGGYGNLVELDHGNAIVTRYGHLSAINVTVGQPVTPGTVVGLLGSTGRSTGPHLHYETRINGGAVDPVRFLQAGAHLFEQPAPSDSVAPAEPADDSAFD